MTAYEPLELEILPPYIGSAVSPTVDITETTNDVTVTITDFRGEHSYSVEKTDQAIADAEQAASNANTAAANATSTANQAAQYARSTADQAAADAQATADAAAETAITAAASANTAAQAANSAASAANGAAQLATTAAGNADTKATLADSKATLANQAATTANQAAQAAQSATADAQTATQAANTAAGTATTAAGNADAKAALADTAAANADTATANANTAATNATNAAQAANNAADVAIEAAEDMPKLVGTVDSVQTVNDAWETTMEGATVYGESIQDGTPTPDNPVPVQVVGGNLFDINGATFAGGAAANIEKTATGVKFENIAGSGGQFSYDTNAEYAPGTYVFGVVPSNNYTRYFVRLRKLDDSGWMTSEDVTITGFSYNNYYSGWYKETGASAIPFTVPNCKYWQFGIGINSIATAPQTVEYIKLEAGTQATPYTPYDCIGLQVGDTITPIDLQGHTLAGLPDGTRDVLRVDGAGRVWIEQNVDSVIANGTETWVASGRRVYSAFIQNTVRGTIPATGTTAAISNRFTARPVSSVSGGNIGFGISDNGTVSINTTGANNMVLADWLAWVAVNNVTIWYPLATPQTIELGTITPPNIAPGDTLAIYASLDPEWAIEYEQDPNIVVNALQSSIAPVEGSTASANYSVGAYLMHGNQLYRVTSAIATGEAITPGSNCVACTVMGEIVRLTA